MSPSQPISREGESDVECAQALDFVEAVQGSHFLDPAYVAAVEVVKRLLTTREITAVDLIGVVVVEVQDAAWVEPVVDAWQDVAKAMATEATPQSDADFLHHKWVAFHGVPKEGRYHSTQTTEQVMRALREGHNLVGVSHAPDRYLPSVLMQTADLRLVVAPFDADLLADTAEAVMGVRPTSLPDADTCARITPAILHMARRRGQTADDFVMRVARLVGTAAARAPQTEWTLDTLHGMAAAVAWGHDLARDLATYSAGRLGWADVDRGCLLVGLPGTGKTTFARALAASCRVPLIAGSFAKWHSTQEGYLSDLLKAMAATFDEARKAAPSILFIDELDSFYNRSADSRHQDWWTAVIGALLEHLDGIERREGVVVVGATNHPDLVDTAIIRSGRLDRIIEIPLPDQDALAAILRVHLGRDLADADLSRAGLLALGATGADCERWVRGARRRARNADRAMVLDDLLAEIGEGSERVRSDDLRIYAVHEAGHALLQVLEEPGTLHHASIRQHREQAGQTVAHVRPAIITEDWLATQLRQALAGRAAEEVVLGRITGGAGGPAYSDLGRATRLALNAETSLGLAGGPLVWRGVWEGKDIGSLMLQRPDLAERVEARLKTAYAGACEVIRTHRGMLDAIVERLLERGVLTGAEVEAVIAKRWCSRRSESEPVAN